MAKRVAFSAKASGATLAGVNVRIAREAMATPTSESPAPSNTIIGNIETRKLERNSASRVARPATCCAIITPEAIVAAVAAVVVAVGEGALSCADKVLLEFDARAPFGSCATVSSSHHRNAREAYFTTDFNSLPT